MNKDLKIIKKYYGEKMAQFCRDYFPSILEQEGILPKIMFSKFGPTHSLYDDIIDNELEEEFKDYIYKFYSFEKKNVETNKSVIELLEEAGYNFYECHSEEDIQAFKKYYAKGEALCTFNGHRLDRCHVFWAVKKDVDKIKREDFLEPTRQDRYGTSVISIQFARGSSNTLSIKNRYNHKVNNPDATFSNNLDNIIPGLTEAFEREYGLNITQSSLDDFELRNYVMGNDGRLYRYNYERNNIYYCENNVIVDNNEVKQLDKSRYLLIDYFIIDLKEKSVKLYDNLIRDSFVDLFKDDIVDKFEIEKQTDNSKTIKIYKDSTTPIIVKIDKHGIIRELIDKNVTEIGNRFLQYNKKLSKIDTPYVKTIGSEFLPYNFYLREISFPNLEEVSDIFICSNKIIKEVNVPKLKKIGSLFLVRNKRIKEIEFKELEEVGDSFLASNYELRKINVPKLKKAGEEFLINNKELEEIYLPELEEVGDYFIDNNEKLRKVYIPKLKKIGLGHRFLTDLIFKTQSLADIIEIKGGRER